MSILVEMTPVGTYLKMPTIYVYLHEFVNEATRMGGFYYEDKFYPWHRVLCVKWLEEKINDA